MSDPEDTIQRMTRLTEAGFDLFIDDFGTGRSSLGYLKRLPASTIKIDRIFVDEAMNSPEDFEYLRNIVALARSRHKSVVLEGVGTAQHYHLLSKTDVDSMQGFYFCEPLSAEDLERVLQQGGQFPA
jgi:EAL domain-containing protein (putative c-di-GMP-specific phosphodiesterase class I)